MLKYVYKIQENMKFFYFYYSFFLLLLCKLTRCSSEPCTDFLLLLRTSWKFSDFSELSSRRGGREAALECEDLALLRVAEHLNYVEITN